MAAIENGQRRLDQNRPAAGGQPDQEIQIFQYLIVGRPSIHTLECLAINHLANSFAVGPVSSQVVLVFEDAYFVRSICRLQRWRRSIEPPETAEDQFRVFG